MYCPINRCICQDDCAWLLTNEDNASFCAISCIAMEASKANHAPDVYIPFKEADTDESDSWEQLKDDCGDYIWCSGGLTTYSENPLDVDATMLAQTVYDRAKALAAAEVEAYKAELLEWIDKHGQSNDGYYATQKVINHIKGGDE